MVDRDILDEHAVLPLRVEDERLIVAMSNPNDFRARSDLTISSGLPITAYVAPEDVIRKLQRTLLPRRQEFAAVNSDTAVARQARRDRRQHVTLKVLVADDDAVDRSIAVRIAETLGHEVVVAEDGIQAWEILSNVPDVDVVLSDWMMPGMDGLELCRKLRSQERGRRMAFIFVTARAGQENLLEGIKAGADDYIAKPLDRDALKFKLNEAARVILLSRHIRDGVINDGESLPEDGRQSAGGTGSGATPHAAGATDDQGSNTVSEDKRNGTGDVNGRGSSAPGTDLAVIGALRRRGTGKAWDILLDQGKLTQTQLDSAIERQRTDERDLGSILLSLGYITKIDLARANAARLRLQFVDLNEGDVDRTVAALIDQRVMRRHKLLPLRLENNRLIVAMSDPSDLYALEDLKMITGYEVTPVVALEDEIQRLQSKLFAISEEISEFLEEASKDSSLQNQDDLDLGMESSPDEAPIIRLVSSVLQRAVGEGASDIHIEPQARELMVRMRVDGVLRETMTIPSKVQNGVVARMKILANLDISERRLPQDGRFQRKTGGTEG